ncbi:MAG: lipid-A-disaccharide synthase N-terminal domain-containing protein, partial [Pseudomonadota bacterium]
MPFDIAFQVLGYQIAIPITYESLWVGFGFLAQAMFMGRFLVQWIASERAKRSIIPVSFWYLSVAGGLMLLTYAIYRQDPVFIFGQASGLFIYLRNLYFVQLERREEQAAAEAAATEAATRVAEWQEVDMRLSEARQRPVVTTAWLTVAAILLAITGYRILVVAFNGVPLFGDEAQYWTWSLLPDWGYYSKPPMVGWAIAASTWLFGHSEGAVRLTPSLTYCVSGLFLFLLARRLFSEQVGVWTAVIFATLPAVSLSSGIVSTDPFLLMFWAIGLYTVHRALEDNGWLWWGATGLAIGLGMLSKYAMIAFIPSLFLFLLISREHRAHLLSVRLYFALAVALVVVSPNIYWNLQNGLATLAHTGDNMNLGGRLFRPEKMAEFLGGQFGVFGPFLFGLLIYFLTFRARTTFADERLKFLAAFILPLFLAILAQSFLSRAHANWAAAVYVPATLLVVALAVQAGWRALLTASVALHVTVAVVLYHYWPITDSLGIQRVHKLDPDNPMKGWPDPYSRMVGWDKMGEKIRAHLDANPGTRVLADDRMTLASIMYYANQDEPDNALSAG